MVTSSAPPAGDTAESDHSPEEAGRSARPEPEPAIYPAEHPDEYPDEQADDDRLLREVPPHY